MRLQIFTLLVVALCQLGHAADMDSKEPQPAIVLSVGSGPFDFSRAIALQVKYHNPGKTSWKIMSPEDSFSVSVKYQLVGAIGHPRAYSVGDYESTTTTRPDGRQMIARLGDSSKPMLVAAGKSHEFEVAFHRRRGRLTPGRWTIWIEDGNLSLESNRIEVPLYFTVASVSTLLEFATNEKHNVTSRKWHGSWLQRIDPDLQLVWPFVNDSAEVKAEREVAIQKELHEFAEYWETAKDTGRVARIIAKINREAGLEPEAEVESESESEAEPAEKASE